jgi:hypothetical protein
MRPSLIILMVAQLSVGCVHEFHNLATATISVGTDKLKIHQDGTATVTGIVLENSHRCEVDARCFLRLRVDNQEVIVVYGPAEGEEVTNVRDTSAEWKIKKGDHIKSYGRILKDTKNSMEVYSSNTFYVHVLTD